MIRYIISTCTLLHYSIYIIHYYIILFKSYIIQRILSTGSWCLTACCPAWGRRPQWRRGRPVGARSCPPSTSCSTPRSEWPSPLWTSSNSWRLSTSSAPTWDCGPGWGSTRWYLSYLYFYIFIYLNLYIYLYIWQVEWVVGLLCMCSLLMNVRKWLVQFC